MAAAEQTIAALLGGIKGRISAVSQRMKLKTEPTLVAVSKTKPPKLLMEAYQAGQRHFGENYVQELVEKAPELPADVRWHFIGHLQSKKCKLIAAIPNIYCVETIDSAKLATTLDKACAERIEKLRVLVQVNTSGEESKSGCTPAETAEIVQHILDKCPKLSFQGLMTIGDFNPEPKADCFQRLVECRDNVLKAVKIPDDVAANFQLSMGMSHDFELAIENGSTMVRVGSAIFGGRQ